MNGKIDNVKSSPERQVKERHFYIGFFLVFVCFFAGTSHAEDVDLTFVNGNIYPLNERQLHAEAIAKKETGLFSPFQTSEDLIELFASG